MKRTASLLLAILRPAFAIGLLTWLAVSGAIHWPAFHGFLAAWPLTLAAALVFLVDLTVTAWRLCVLLKPAGLHLSLLASARLALMGLFFTVCLPGAVGGDLVRIYYAAIGNEGRRVELATIVLLDRALGMFAMIVWPLLAAPLFPALLEKAPVLRGLLSGAAALAIAMAAAMWIGSAGRVRSSRLLLWVYRLPLGGLVQKVLETVHGYRRYPGALFGAAAISLLAHTLSVGVILLVALALNPGGFAWEMSILAPLGFLANTLPFTPGGLGVGEAVFDKLFTMAGLTGGVEIMLGWRLIMLLVSLPGCVFYLQGRRRLVQASNAEAPRIQTNEVSL